MDYFSSLGDEVDARWILRLLLLHNPTYNLYLPLSWNQNFNSHWRSFSNPGPVCMHCQHAGHHPWTTIGPHGGDPSIGIRSGREESHRKEVPRTNLVSGCRWIEAR